LRQVLSRDGQIAAGWITERPELQSLIRGRVTEIGELFRADIPFHRDAIEHCYSATAALPDLAAHMATLPDALKRLGIAASGNTSFVSAMGNGLSLAIGAKQDHLSFQCCFKTSPANGEVMRRFARAALGPAAGLDEAGASLLEIMDEQFVAPRAGSAWTSSAILAAPEGGRNLLDRWLVAHDFRKPQSREERAFALIFGEPRVDWVWLWGSGANLVGVKDCSDPPQTICVRAERTR
jgi:hypothetical protein